MSTDESTPDLAHTIIATFSASLTDLSFWIGLFSVVLFAKNRFAISLPEPDNLSPPIAARSFTTAFRYQIAAFTYVSMFVAFYFALILIGCLPWLQSALKQWVGTLGDIEGEQIGTPAWAALAATTLLPSAPRFEKFDRWIREMFQDFASIPQKADLIGREIIHAVAQGDLVPIEEESPIADVHLAIEAHRRQFKELNALSRHLKSISGPPNVRRSYEKFFAVADKLLDAIRGDFKFDKADAPSDETIRQLEARLSNGLRRMAKLLACALLQAERSELAIGERLTNADIAVRRTCFNFTAKHLIPMFVTVAGMTFLGCYLSLLAFALAQDNTAELLQRYGFMYLTLPYITWPLATVIVYLLPVVLSAGAVMYRLDRRAWEQTQDFTDRFTSGVMVFIGSAGLAFLSILAYSVTLAAIGNATSDPQSALGFGTSPVIGPRAGAPIPILTLLPWCLPPATVATLFLFNSTRSWGLGKWSGAAIDAAMHGGGAALASACAYLLGTLLGDRFYALPEAGMMTFLAPISAFMVGAGIGAVLCATTRQRVCKATAAHAPRPQMPLGALVPAV